MQKKYLKNAAIIIGFAIALSLYIVFEAWSIHKLPTQAQAVLFVMLFFMIVGMFIQWLSNKIFERWLDPVADNVINEMDRIEQGEEGENGICAELYRVLDKDKYTIHRNFKIPHKKFDIDAIVVGSKGIIVFEIKNYTNRMAFNYNDAFVETKSGFKRILSKNDPRNEVDSYCYELQKYFNVSNLRGLPIHKAVAFLKKDVAIILSSKVRVYIISGFNELDKYIATLPDDPRFTPKVCDVINKLLN